MQADEVETDDVLLQLFNFMPDLIIVSAAHLLRDPRLTIPRRIQASNTEDGTLFRRASSLRPLASDRPSPPFSSHHVCAQALGQTARDYGVVTVCLSASQEETPVPTGSR